MSEEYTFPDFTFKVVSFSCGDNMITLYSPTFEEQGDRIFVVGTIPKDGTANDWAEDRPAAIAWDTVSDYIVFDSPEQFSELIELADDKNEWE